MFELANEGYRNPFEQLVACLISVRTRDEVSIAVARRLFQVARTPEDFKGLSIDALDELLRPATFHRAKATQILKIADIVRERYRNQLPCDSEALLSFAGAGPKCANLVLGIACSQSKIGVDVHVHRVTNRWGFVQTSKPVDTMIALEARLPRRYWVEINELLVAFGKHTCTGVNPRCSRCPLLHMCRQVGVGAHR